MAWPTYTADVTQNSNQIKLYGAVPASDIPLGDEVIVYGATVTANLEVASGSAIMYDGDGSPYSFLYLARPYTGQSSTGVDVVIKPTGSLARDIVEIFRKGTDQSNQLMSNYHQFAEGATPITHQPLDENAAPLSIKTLPMMEDEVEQAISQLQGAAGTAYAYDVTESASDSSLGDNNQLKLLKAGDGGLLAKNRNIDVPDSNINTLRVNGMFRTASTTIGNALGSYIGQILHMGQGSEFAAQLHLKSQSAGGLVSKYRVIDAGTPSDWVEFIHTGNTGITPSAGGRTLVGTSIDNGLDQLQVKGTLMNQTDVGKVSTFSKTITVPSGGSATLDTVTGYFRNRTYFIACSGYHGSVGHLGGMIVASPYGVNVDGMKKSSSNHISFSGENGGGIGKVLVNNSYQSDITVSVTGIVIDQLISN